MSKLRNTGGANSLALSMAMIEIVCVITLERTGKEDNAAPPPGMAPA